MSSNDENQMLCDCVKGSVLIGSREPIFFRFVLNASLG